MIKANLRIKPIYGRLGYFDFKFYLTNEKPGYTGFMCELQGYKLTSETDYNALKIAILAYEKLASKTVEQFEVHPVPTLAGRKEIQNFTLLPPYNFFLTDIYKINK